MNVKKKYMRKRRDEEDSERRFVPWFNMAEWDEVYKQLYSDETATQIKGFERLLLWKARCPQGIPAGAQCTIDLIQICLKDREVWPLISNGSLALYNQHELQLMYSVAILRFLNHFTPLVKSKPNESLYDLAKKLHIPDWVVNLRHETAHSQNLPSLNILREAAHFCLEWIHEYYWKNEAELSADLVLNGKSPESSDVIDLKDIVENWQAVMMYSKAGILTYKDIPDEKLKKQLLDKRLIYDTFEIKQMKKKLRAEGHVVEGNEIEEAQLVIIKELMDYLERCDDLGEAYSHLVDVLLEGDGFLASSDFISVFNTKYDKWRLQNDSLPVHFINLWKTMLDFIQQGKLIPLLLKKLIALTNVESENSIRCKMAALWIKELALSIFKTKKAIELKERLIGDKDCLHKVKKSFSGKLSKEKLQRKISASDIHRLMIQKVEDGNPNFKQIMTLKMQKLPNSLTDMELLGEAVKKPNKWTSIFLPCLMDLVEPPLIEDSRKKLITLVNIYTQETLLPNNEHNITESPVYTVDNLENPLLFENKESNDVEIVETQIDDSCMGKTVVPSTTRESIWIRYDDGMNWSKCPIGRLPWQDSETLLNIDFPYETTWQPIQKGDNYEKTLPGFFHKKINWEEILRKRPRRSRNLQDVPTSTDIVNKAVNVALIENS